MNVKFNKMLDNDNKDAIFFSSLHALAFAFSTVIIKWLSTSFPVLEQIFARSIVGLFFLLPYLWKVRTEVFSRSWPLLIFRGVAGFIGVFCLFYTVGHLPLLIAMILTLITPVFVMVFGFLFLGEKITSRQTIYSITIMFSVITLVYPNNLSIATLFENKIGEYIYYIVIGFIGSIVTAAAFISVKASLKRVSVNVVVFYFLLCNIVLSLLLGGNEFIYPSAVDFGVLVILGLIGLISDRFKTRAYKKAVAGIVSVVSLMSIVFASLFGFIMFDEKISLLQCLGIVVLVVCIYMLSRPNAAVASPIN